MSPGGPARQGRGPQTCRIRQETRIRTRWSSDARRQTCRERAARTARAESAVCSPSARLRERGGISASGGATWRRRRDSPPRFGLCELFFRKPSLVQRETVDFYQRFLRRRSTGCVRSRDMWKLGLKKWEMYSGGRELVLCNYLSCSHLKVNFPT